METEINMQSESQSSVEFSTTSKGVLSFKIKVYNLDPDIAFQKATQLTEQAQRYVELKNKIE